MKRDVDPEDAKLFRDAMQDVKRLQEPARHAPHPARPAPRPRQREADERAVLHEMMHAPMGDVGDELSWRAGGVQDGVFRQLRRGTYHVGAELDLHGMRASEAKHAVAHFLGQASEAGIRCVRIIHGKGLRSKGQGPVLKQYVDGWLRRRDDVLAYCSARPHHGGTGAVYVLLRAP